MKALLGILIVAGVMLARQLDRIEEGQADLRTRVANAEAAVTVLTAKVEAAERVADSARERCEAIRYAQPTPTEPPREPFRPTR